MSRWIFEPGHTEVEFRARHMMVTWVRGLFKDIHGAVQFDPDRPMDATFQGEIDAARIWTGEPTRDAHLRSADFLDVDHHPKIVFAGRVSERTGDMHAKASVEVTIRGVTRPVVLAVAYLVSGRHRFGSVKRTAARCGGSALRPPPRSTATTSASPGRTTCRAVAWWSATRSTPGWTWRRSSRTIWSTPARSSTTGRDRRASRSGGGRSSATQQEAVMTQPQPAYAPTSHVLVQTEADRAATPPQQLTCVISADLRPGDRQALLELFDRSSPETRRERFHGSLSVFPQRYLDDILTGTHGQLALVARDTCHPANYGKVFGLASAAPIGPGTAEFAVWVDDAWQGHGVGTLLVRAILHLLARQGMTTAVGIMEPGNGAIRRLLGRVAPQATTRFEDGMIVVSVPLAQWAAAAGAIS
jgi:polyisoprenoid-binding protein YceI/GNAT superfamily N-acetyltransferase